MSLSSLFNFNTSLEKFMNMISIKRSSVPSSLHSFQSYVPFTSTPKRSTKSLYQPPLSSTLSVSASSCQNLDLSISAICSDQRCPVGPSKKRSRRTKAHYRASSTLKQRIELKCLLYSNRAMKYQESKQRHYTDAEMKIYLVWKGLSWSFFFIWLIFLE